jgi:hypothetical protein
LRRASSLGISAVGLAGPDDIITVLTTAASEWQQRASLRLDDHQTTDPLTWPIAGLSALVTLLTSHLVFGGSS